MSDFMQPSTDYFVAAIVDTSNGIQVVDTSYLSDSIADTDEPTDEQLSLIRDYIEPGSEVYSIEVKEGWFARLSAPGYMDCTSWQGPYESEAEALADLESTYGD